MVVQQQNTVNNIKKGTMFYVLSVLIECFDVHQLYNFAIKMNNTWISS